MTQDNPDETMQEAITTDADNPKSDKNDDDFAAAFDQYAKMDNDDDGEAISSDAVEAYAKPLNDLQENPNRLDYNVAQNDEMQTDDDEDTTTEQHKAGKSENQQADTRNQEVEQLKAELGQTMSELALYQNREHRQNQEAEERKNQKLQAGLKRMYEIDPEQAEILGQIWRDQQKLHQYILSQNTQNYSENPPIAIEGGQQNNVTPITKEQLDEFGQKLENILPGSLEIASSPQFDQWSHADPKIMEMITSGDPHRFVDAVQIYAKQFNLANQNPAFPTDQRNSANLDTETAERNKLASKRALRKNGAGAIRGQSLGKDVNGPPDDFDAAFNYHAQKADEELKSWPKSF